MVQRWIRAYALVLAGPSGEPVLQVTSTSAFGRPLAGSMARLHAAAAGVTAMTDATPLVTAILDALGAGVARRPLRKDAHAAEPADA